MGKQKHWQCALCGHVVLAEKKPHMPWGDGHTCIFYEQPKIIEVFREVNDAFYEKGLVTNLSTNEKYCNLVVYEDGHVVAAVSEMPRSKKTRIKVIMAHGETKTFDLLDRQEIISMVMKVTKIQA